MDVAANRHADPTSPTSNRRCNRSPRGKIELRTTVDGRRCQHSTTSSSGSKTIHDVESELRSRSSVEFMVAWGSDQRWHLDAELREHPRLQTSIHVMSRR